MNIGVRQFRQKYANVVPPEAPSHVNPLKSLGMSMFLFTCAPLTVVFYLTRFAFLYTKLGFITVYYPIKKLFADKEIVESNSHEEKQDVVESETKKHKNENEK